MAVEHSDTKRRRVVTASGPQVSVANTVPDLAAQPVDRHVAPKEDSFLRLADSLSKASPAFKMYFEGRRKQQEDESEARGEQQALKDSIGNDIDESSSFDRLSDSQTSQEQVGYMRVSGMLYGKQKARELEDTFNNAFNKDTDNFDAFVAKFLHENTKGLEDVDYSQSFLQEIQKKEDALRTVYVDYQKTQIEVQKQAGIVSMTDSLAVSMDDLSSTEQVQALEVIYKDANVLKLSFPKIDEAVYSSLSSRAVNEGKPELLEVLKVRRNGAPTSMYENPKWKDKIDATQLAARKVKQKAIDDADVAETKRTKEWRESNDRKLSKIAAEGGNVRAAYNEMVAKDGLTGPHARAWESILDANEKEVTEDSDKADKELWKENSSVIRSQIYDDEITWEEIKRSRMSREIGETEFKDLSNLYHQVNDEEGFWKSSIYTQAREHLSRTLAPIDTRNVVERKLHEVEAESLRRANGLAEFNENLRNYLEEHGDVPRDIIEQFREDAEKRWTNPKAPTIKPNPIYKTERELVDAFRAGEVDVKTLNEQKLLY